MGYIEGFNSNKDRTVNPFAVVLDQVNKGYERRRAEDKLREEEDRKLKFLFQQMAKQGEIEKEKEILKGQIEGKLIPSKQGALPNTPVSSTMPSNAGMSMADGTIGDVNGNPVDMGAGIVQQAGLAPKPQTNRMLSFGGNDYEIAPDIERQVKEENLKYMQGVNKRMGGDNSGSDVVYRRADTGEEVAREVAEKDIAQGDRNYIINQRVASKSGVKETPLVSTQDRKFMDEQEENKKVQQQKSQMVLDTAQDTLNTIAEVEKGMKYFGTFGNVPSIPGSSRKTWESNIDKLLSSKILNTITTMKEASKTGATGFGQLNVKELQVLQNASTALRKDLPRPDAQNYINDMKKAVNKILSKEQAQSMTQGQTPAGNTFKKVSE